MADDVIYDSMNTQVWYEGDPSTGKKTSKQVFGKHYKKFSNNNEARAYAVLLGKMLGARVYDKYHGEYLTFKKPTSKTHKTHKPKTHRQESLEGQMKKILFG